MLNVIAALSADGKSTTPSVEYLVVAGGGGSGGYDGSGSSGLCEGVCE